MRAAIADRNTDFDGRFFYGVVTTGIFCRPSCSSRPPRPENLRFFADAASAISAGFRSCKRCRPLELAPGLDLLVDVARHIESHADERLTLAVLAKRADMSASCLQRTFRQTFGISPKAYQDAIRLQRLKDSLRAGDDVSGAIYEAGYGSPSRVYGEKSRNIGMTPKAYRAGGAGETIHYACRDTALGPLMMAATTRGVCFAQFGEDPVTLRQRLQAEFPKATLSASDAAASPELDAWVEALEAHISAGAPRPDLPLDLRGTAFQIKVWRFLIGTGDGEVMSYAEVAAGVESPKAVRAVASACAANRIGVLVPCHRVLRSDGGLGGYRWGAPRKRALLDAERSRRLNSK